MTVVFFGNSLSAMVLFLQLATRWPAVARAWARIEYDMRTYGYPRHLGRKIKIMTAVVLLLATVEHLLAVMTAVYTSWPCYKSGGFPGLIRGYSLNNFAMVRLAQHVVLSACRTPCRLSPGVEYTYCRVQKNATFDTPCARDYP